jgi:peptide chain release factor
LKLAFRQVVVANAVEVWLQITAGKGPEECALAVVKVLEHICVAAADAGLRAKTIQVEPGPQAGTAVSALIVISGPQDLKALVDTWRGTVQWIARSPFRPEHKWKNWFVGVEVLEPVEETHFNPKDVKWETMRASGPGGCEPHRICRASDAFANRRPGNGHGRALAAPQSQLHWRAWRRS